MADEWSVKRISFLGREQVPILLQNANGPCPLLAIANCLALRNQLQTPSRAATVTFSEVVSRVADGLLETNKVALGTKDSAQQQEENAYVLNLRQNIDDCLGVLRWAARSLAHTMHARASLSMLACTWDCSCTHVVLHAALNPGIPIHVLFCSTLNVGLDVNPRFHDVLAFEATKELTVFDLMGIQLFHGWVVDPMVRDREGERERETKGR